MCVCLRLAAEPLVLPLLDYSDSCYLILIKLFTSTREERTPEGHDLCRPPDTLYCSKGVFLLGHPVTFRSRLLSPSSDYNLTHKPNLSSRPCSKYRPSVCPICPV